MVGARTPADVKRQDELRTGGAQTHGVAGDVSEIEISSASSPGATPPKADLPSWSRMPADDHRGAFLSLDDDAWRRGFELTYRA